MRCPLSSCGRSLISIEQAWQHGRAFDAHRVQVLRIDAEGSQDRRGDLRGEHRSFDRRALQSWVGNDEPNVDIPETCAALFGIFLARPGVDRAIDRLHEDVGSSAIVLRAV